MKAYVIKNKEDGKYLSKYFNYDYADKNYKHICGTKNIINAKILKECFDTNDDFECVEITIAEGDLEKENEVLRKALERLYRLIFNTRLTIKHILIVDKRPVKGTTKEDCYEALEKLQTLYDTARCITTSAFLDRIVEGE